MGRGGAAHPSRSGSGAVRTMNTQRHADLGHALQHLATHDKLIPSVHHHARERARCPPQIGRAHV